MRPHVYSSPRTVRGLTLIELMVGVTLLVVLLSLAVPSFRTQIAAGQLSSATNELIASLSRARMEAMRTGGRVTVCKTGGSASQCDASATQGWERGWLVVRDPKRSNSASVDSGETISFVVSPQPADLKIDGTSQVSAYVSFAATGQSKLMGSTPQAGIIRICSTSPALRDSNRARELSLVATGRIVTTIPASVGADCPSPT